MGEGRRTPYVGVSGVVSPEQQDRLVRAARTAGLDRAGRQLLLGVKGTHKTQYDDVANKYGPYWYPVGDQSFATALSAAPGVAGTQRVAQLYLERDYVTDASYRRRFMDRIVGRGKTWLTGLQFDMLPWDSDPTVRDFLRQTRTRYGLPVYLQAHGPAMRALGPLEVAAALAELGSAVDYVLFDSSHGTGADMDTHALGGFVEAAYAHPALRRTGIAVAGGLDAHMLGGMADLVGEFAALSWDAEGKLHPDNGFGRGLLDEVVAGDYLEASVELLMGPDR